jgi:hypothetical protein
MAQPDKQSSMAQLRARVTCPHCWNTFPPEEVLWISAHPDLLGDPLLGEDAQQRFLATRFTVEGHAIDVKGVTCSRLACPQCHLSVGRALLEMKPLFISIIGAPSSGKSYFLAAMSWQLRNCLRDRLNLSFQDADPIANQILSDYEDALFNNPIDDQLVTLPKTEKEGQLYESVSYGERVVWYPRPFVFSIKPMETHPSYPKRRLLSQALCLYDNAGEHFQPGGESPNSPGTQHLALSEVLLFMFDPTQHVRFRKACQGVSKDPQMSKQGWTNRQDLVLLEAANRIRRYSGLGESEKYSRPLVVVVTKFDAWCGLTGAKRLSTSRVVRPVGPSLSAIDRDAIENISKQVRSVLNKYSPELVAAAEGFSTQVTYIPVSALGQSPEVDQKTGFLGIRPRDIKPMWAEIPMLYAINRVAEGLVRTATRADREQQSPASAPPVRQERDAQADAADAADPPSPRLWKETGS